MIKKAFNDEVCFDNFTGVLVDATPVTGDAANPWLWAAMILLSMAGVAVMKCGVKTEVFKNVKQRSQLPLKNDKSMQNYPLKNDNRSAIMIVWRCDYAK